MKKLFMFATLLAILGSFVACSSNDTIEGTNNNKGNKTLTIQMSLAPATRVSYTDDGTNLKAKFSTDDYINIFFRKVVGTTITNQGNYMLKCTSVSADGTLATFATDANVDISTIPDGATDVHMILSNPNNKPTFNGTGNFTNDLSAQDGTLADATAHMQWATNLDLTNSANYEVSDGAIKLKNIAFDPTLCTSILKLNITYPKNTNVVAGETPIKCFSEGAYSKYTCTWGVAGAPTTTDGTTTPFTTTKPATVTENADGTKTATSYVCIWPIASSFQVVNFSTAIDDVTYPAEYTTSRATDENGKINITGGKMYTVNATCSTPTKVVTKWYNDNTQTLTALGTNGTSADNWLTMNGSTINIAANTTGTPRTGSIVVDENGVSTTYKITQVAPADFKGSYTYTTKVFAGSGSLVAATDPYTFQTITFSNPRKTEELTDADGTKRTNNIGITGLYSTAVIDADVDINYDAQTIKIGLFLDARDGQGQQVNGNYVAFVPTLVTRTSTAWAKPWKFDETTLGNPDYTWVWYTVNSVNGGLFNQIMYYNRANNNVELSEVPQYSSSTMNQIGGIDVVLSITDVFTPATVSGYAQVYQVNAKGQLGSFFTKTANNGAKEYTGANAITAKGYTVK